MTNSPRLLIVAAGAAFLALLDVTVVNLAIPALGSAYPRAEYHGTVVGDHRLRDPVRGLLAPAGPAGRRDRAADAVPDRRRWVRAWCRPPAPQLRPCRSLLDRAGRCRARPRRR